MVQTETPKRIEHIKRFLILRLMLVLLFVLMSEAFLNVLFGQIAFPRINAYFQSEFAFGKQAFETNMFMLMRIAFFMFLSGLSKGLPLTVSRAFPFLIDKYVDDNMQNMVRISGPQRFLILMILFVILISYTMPYIIAVLYYSGVVVKMMEEVREYDKKQQEEFTKRRNLLLSDITHDLKTPITTMAGYAQALNDGMVDDPVKQKRYLDAIHRKSLEMSELITLLFHYVKMDSEGFTLKLERENMAEIVLQIVAGAYTDIEDAGMEVDIDIPEEAVYANLDKAQFTRAVTNLVMNAVKHNDAGTRIKVSMVKDMGYWIIRIMDSGVAIEQSLLANIFDPFVMGDESRNRRGGSGLGLSVTRKIIEMHEGKIYVEQPTAESYTKAFCIRISELEDYSYEVDENRISL